MIITLYIMPVRKYKPTDNEEENYILKTAAPDMISGIVEQIKRSIITSRATEKRTEEMRAARLAKKAAEKAAEEKKANSSDDEETKRTKRIAKHKKDKEEKEAREKHYDETYDPDYEIAKDTIYRSKVITQKKKKVKKRKGVKPDSESESSSDSESIHEFFETIGPELHLDMKSINKYYMSKTPEIKVPDKVIEVDNRGHLSLVDTLDSHGDINKVNGHKVLDVISYVPDSAKDSKIKVKQGNHSDLSKEVKKVEGKIKRSKKPATITKLNNELNELLNKLS